MGKRKKKLQSPDTSIILRNVILGVGLELIISYYYNRVFFLKVVDYKRKVSLYRRSKLFYLRANLNRETRIKQ